MQLTLLTGYPDRVGRRFRWVGFGNGPASYVGGATGGDPIVLPLALNQGYIDSVGGDRLSLSGNFIVRAQPKGVGARQTWVLRWFTLSTGVEVVNTTNLSAEQVQFAGDGGFF